MTRSAFLGAVAAVALFAGTAHAAPIAIDFGSGETTGGGPTSVYSEDGFNFTPASTPSSSICPGDAPCLRLNNGNFNDVHLTFDGGVFDLRGFSVDFSAQGQGNPPTLTVTGLDGSDVEIASHIFDISDEVVISFASGEFDGVSKIRFTQNGAGTVRIDDLHVTPLPAALPLFAAGVAGLAWMRRRRAV